MTHDNPASGTPHETHRYVNSAHERIVNSVRAKCPWYDKMVTFLTWYGQRGGRG